MHLQSANTHSATHTEENKWYMVLSCFTSRHKATEMLVFELPCDFEPVIKDAVKMNLTYSYSIKQSGRKLADGQKWPNKVWFIVFTLMRTSYLEMYCIVLGSYDLESACDAIFQNRRRQIKLMEVNYQKDQRVYLHVGGLELNSRLWRLWFTIEPLDLSAPPTVQRAWLLPVRSLGGSSDQSRRGRSCESPERNPGHLTVSQWQSIKVVALQASRIYLHTGSTSLDGLSFQSDFAAARPQAAPVLNDPGVLQLKDLT